MRWCPSLCWCSVVAMVSELVLALVSDSRDVCFCVGVGVRDGCSVGSGVGAGVLVWVSELAFLFDVGAGPSWRWCSSLMSVVWFCVGAGVGVLVLVSMLAFFLGGGVGVLVFIFGVCDGVGVSVRCWGWRRF